MAWFLVGVEYEGEGSSVGVIPEAFQEMAAIQADDEKSAAEKFVRYGCQAERRRDCMEIIVMPFDFKRFQVLTRKPKPIYEATERTEQKVNCA